MAKLENICKNAESVKKFYKEQYLDRKQDLNTDKFPISEALYVLEKCHLMAEYGEKDATYQELEPYFLADHRTGREIVGYKTFEEHFSGLISTAKNNPEFDLEEFKRVMKWEDMPKLGDFVLLSSEIYAEFTKIWNSKDMTYAKGQACVDKARKEFAKEYDIVDWFELGTYKRKQQWEISRCKEPKPDTNYRVDRTFVFSEESDIIITDPCYIYEWIGNNHDEWTCDNIPSSRDTIYGDWSCSIYECEKGKSPKAGTKPFGSFCADAGLVCVEDIRNCPKKAEILDWVKSHGWCATVIPNFKGNVEYKIRTDYYAENAKWNPEESLIVCGYGTKDSKDFAFTTAQTGL